MRRRWRGSAGGAAEPPRLAASSVVRRRPRPALCPDGRWSWCPAEQIHQGGPLRSRQGLDRVSASIRVGALGWTHPKLTNVNKHGLGVNGTTASCERTNCDAIRRSPFAQFAIREMQGGTCVGNHSWKLLALW